MLEAVRRNVALPIASIVGPVGPRASVIEFEAAEGIEAGQPVRPNLAGKVMLAQADTLLNSRQVAIAAAAASEGHPVGIQRDFVTLDDWTAATGSAQLAPLSQYFLDAVNPGRLVTAPPSAGVVLPVGIALNFKTLAVGIGQPILL
jgi:hypothetical protein